VGRVDGLQFRLKTRNPSIRNFADSILVGQIVESQGGSRLLGTFQMEKFAAIFLPVWLAGAMLMAITASVSALIAPERWSPPPPPVLPLIFPLLPILAVAAGRWLATQQERRLLTQLDEIFGINPNGTEPSG
jgi:hypothetical protein